MNSGESRDQSEPSRKCVRPRADNWIRNGSAATTETSGKNARAKAHISGQQLFFISRSASLVNCGPVCHRLLRSHWSVLPAISPDHPPTCFQLISVQRLVIDFHDIAVSFQSISDQLLRQKPILRVRPYSAPFQLKSIGFKLSSGKFLGEMSRSKIQHLRQAMQTQRPIKFE